MKKAMVVLTRMSEDDFVSFLQRVLRSRRRALKRKALRKEGAPLEFAHGRN